MRKVVLKTFVFLLALLFVGCSSQYHEQVGELESETILFSRLTGDYWQIWQLNPANGDFEQLTSSPFDKRYPFWNGVNRQIYFRDNNNRVYYYSSETRRQVRILQQMGLIGSVRKSPLSEDMLITRFRTELVDSSDLWIVSPGGKERKIITRDVGLQYDPAWSPDGTKIAFISGHGYQTHELYIMNADGTNKRRLTENKALELTPSFSSDGNKLAYVSNITDDFEIWVTDLTTGDTQQITDSEGIDTCPQWSKDNSKILFTSNRSGNLQVWLMDADGTSARQLTSGPASMDPSWKGSY